MMMRREEKKRYIGCWIVIAVKLRRLIPYKRDRILYESNIVSGLNEYY
jgi:hypothetical protein